MQDTLDACTDGLVDAWKLLAEPPEQAAEVALALVRLAGHLEEIPDSLQRCNPLVEQSRVEAVMDRYHVAVDDGEREGLIPASIRRSFDDSSICRLIGPAHRIHGLRITPFESSGRAARSRRARASRSATL